MDCAECLSARATGEGAVNLQETALIVLVAGLILCVGCFIWLASILKERKRDGIEW